MNAAIDRRPRTIRRGDALRRIGHTLRRGREVRLPHAHGLKRHVGANRAAGVPGSTGVATFRTEMIGEE
eukprot:4644884-Prymnesium_polylepis.1